MRTVGLLAGSVAVIGAAAILFALAQRGASEPANAGADVGPPPPCYVSWDDAKAHGVKFPTPDGGHRIVLFPAAPLPTRGPPFDMTKTPPPPGFNSWDEVIAGWKKAKDAGLLDIAPSTPVVSGTLPPGCASWDEFMQWMERQFLPALNGSP